MCGIIGISANNDVAGDLYDGMMVLQHRGQDAAGMLTYDTSFHMKRGLGMVRDIFDEHNMTRLTGASGIGHLRYPTVGVPTIDDAQPFMVNSPFGIGMIHNGNLVNYNALKLELMQTTHRYISSSCDVEVILNIFADELDKLSIGETLTFDHLCTATQGTFNRLTGAYSVIGMIAGEGMFAFRDPYGIRPLIMGKRETDLLPEYIFASENVAIQTLGYEIVGDVQPGEIVFIDKKRQVHRKVVDQRGYCPCIFEYVYFARPDSIIDGISVHKARTRMGEKIAERIKMMGLHIDAVMPVPDSARTSALAIAQSLQIPYREGLVKNRYIGRTFIMPGQGIREKSVRYKLNPVPLEFENKEILLVDDSIVRGTTSRKIVRMCKKAGAKKVHFVSVAPEITYPYPYGIDFATKKELIASNLDNDAICKEICADTLIYQTIGDLVEAVGGGPSEHGESIYNPNITRFTRSMFDGEYTTGPIEQSYWDTIVADREKAQAVEAKQMRLL